MGPPKHGTRGFNKAVINKGDGRVWRNHRGECKVWQLVTVGTFIDLKPSRERKGHSQH